MENTVSRAFLNNVRMDCLVGVWGAPVHQERLAWSVHRERVVNKCHVVNDLQMETMFIRLSKADYGFNMGGLLVGKLNTFLESISVQH